MTLARMYQRRDTAATWASVNPILSAGEFGYEEDTGRVKVGDGTAAWNALGYLPTASDIASKANTVDVVPNVREIAGLALSEDRSAADLVAAMDQELAAKIVPGANLPRTLAKLRRGEPITWAHLGASKTDPGTTGNAGGSKIEKAAALVEDRFGVTVTVVNVAESGDTAATQYLGGGVGAVVAAEPDLLTIELGTNDSNADQFGQWAAGYPMAASLAAVERACAYVRQANESAEIMLIGTTPYQPASSSNAKIVAYNKGVAELAAVLGAEYADLYSVFWDDPVFQDDYTTYLLDSTHPNPTGNDVLAAALLDHFPTDAALRVAAPLAPPPVSGRYGIALVDKAVGNLGYKIYAGAGSDDDGSVVLTGTWTIDGNYDVTTTASDSFTLTGAHARELLAQIDLGSSAIGTSYPVVDFYLDDVLVGEDVNLHTQSGKDSAAYWLAPFTGLDGGEHAMKVVLKSGTLRVGTYAYLVGASAPFTPETVEVDFGETSSSLNLSDGSTKYAVNTTLNLPSGWGSARVKFEGRMGFRAVGTTTSVRWASCTLRVGGDVRTVDYATVAAIATSGESHYTQISVLDSMAITGDVNVRLEARAVSTDKDNFFAASNRARLIATLVRTS